MNPKYIKEGAGLYLHYIQKRKGIRTLHVVIEKIHQDKSVTVLTANGGRMTYTHKAFNLVAGRFDAQPLFRLTVVALSGGWRDVDVGNKLSEAVRRAYLIAMEYSTRVVTINREQRWGVAACVAQVAAHDGRCWMGKHGTLGGVQWKGEPPDPASGAIEITGKFELAPPSYVI